MRGKSQVFWCVLAAALAACSGSEELSVADAQFGQPAADVVVDDALASDDAAVSSSPGSCVGASVGAACSDNDCCTLGDTCQPCDAASDPMCTGQGMKCVGSPACVDDDDKACTLAQCSCVEGEAPVCATIDTPDGAPCDFDPNDCTLGDACLAGECIKSQPLPLDDGNPCTEDACVKGELVHAPLMEGQCDDGNECTTGDACVQGTCTGGEPVACVVGPCMADAQCVPGEGCVASPLPVGAFCGTDNACVLSAACDADANCEVVEYLDCDDGNPCTADSCDPINGCVHAHEALEGEVCDLSSDAACVSGGVCLQGGCVAASISGCIDDDGCCAEGCNTVTDNDCSASCGNGVLEAGEVCDGDCPVSCDGADACQYGVLVGDPASCSAECTFMAITQCIQGDGCCPAGCTSATDNDCVALCGNGIIDPGELCDGLCPTACQGDDSCGAPQLVGSPETCDAECVAPTTSCVNGDGCCPSSCDASNDDDCAPVNPCDIQIEIECVDHPSWAIQYKVSVTASPGVMNFFWNPTAVDEPQMASMVQGGFCWNTTGDTYLTHPEPVGCFDVVYDTVTDTANCSNNGPVSSCAAQRCYDCTP